MKLFAKKLGLDISSPIFSSPNISKNHGEQMKLESKMAFLSHVLFIPIPNCERSAPAKTLQPQTKGCKQAEMSFEVFELGSVGKSTCVFL